jgi:hypothetical protein
LFIFVKCVVGWPIKGELELVKKMFY